MDLKFSNLLTWLDVVDFASEIANGAEAEDVVFVDVCGGNGSRLAALKKNGPGVKGRMILQDQAYMLERALEVHGMEKRMYDFLKQQPFQVTRMDAFRMPAFVRTFIPSARVYYFRRIIHNFDDETCVRKLKAQLPALGAHSVVVLDDRVLTRSHPRRRLVLNIQPC